MKKMKLIFTLVLLVIISSSCLFDKLYQDRMREYYSNDENYVELEGEVVEITTALIYISIPLESDFNVYKEEKIPFVLYSNEEILEILCVGDMVKFVSASRYFYDGHRLPIVSLEINGIEYLTFEDGKAGLLEWVEAFY